MRAFISSPRIYNFNWFFSRAIKNVIKTEVPCQFQLFCNDIEEQDLCCAHYSCPLGRHQSDRSGTENSNSLSDRRRLRSAECVQRNCSRLSHRCLFQCHALRYRYQIRHRCDDIFSKSTVASRAEIVIIVALNILSLFTRRTCATPEQRKNNDSITL